MITVDIHFAIVLILLLLCTRQAKDVVKGIKKRLGSKNPKVQLLALTVNTCNSNIYI